MLVRPDTSARLHRCDIWKRGKEWGEWGDVGEVRHSASVRQIMAAARDVWSFSMSLLRWREGDYGLYGAMKPYITLLGSYKCVCARWLTWFRIIKLGVQPPLCSGRWLADVRQQTLDCFPSMALRKNYKWWWGKGINNTLCHFERKIWGLGQPNSQGQVPNVLWFIIYFETFGSQQYFFSPWKHKQAPPDVLLISRPEKFPPILSPFKNELTALCFDKKRRSRLLSVF